MARVGEPGSLVLEIFWSRKRKNRDSLGTTDIIKRDFTIEKVNMVNHASLDV